MRAALLLCVLLSIPSDSGAQWGDLAGAPVGARPVLRRPILPRIGYEWRDAGGQIDLWKDSKQVGAYDPVAGIYRPLLDWAKSTWGEPCDPPFPVPDTFRPETAPKSEKPIENFGLDLSKLGSCTTPKYVLGGREISAIAAYEYVEKGLPDDRSKLRLTVIGTEAERKPVLDAWQSSENADLRDKVLPWFCAADHWSAKDTVTGNPLFAAGHPAIYVQGPDGKVLGREAEFKPGETFGAIRKAVADYDAKKDPPLLPRPKPPDEPKKPDDKKPDSPMIHDQTLPVCVVCGCAAVFLFILRRNSNAPNA